MTSQRLRELETKVLNGESVDWDKVHEAQALGLAASDQEFLEEITEHERQQLEWLQRDRDTGDPTEPGSGPVA